MSASLPPQQHSNMAYVYAFLMSMVGASAAAALKFISADVSIEWITFLQYGICLLISLLVIKQQGITKQQLLAIDKRDRWIFLVRGLSGLLGFYCFYLAVANIPLVDATMLRHSSPLFVPIIALVFLRLQTQRITQLFIIIGLLGVFITLQPDFSNFNSYYGLGLLSAIFLAVSMVTTNRLRQYPSTMVLFYYYLISFLGMLPLGIVYWQSVSAIEAMVIAYVGSSIHIALWLYTKAFTLSSAASVSPITYFSVVHAGILGWLIWGHIPSWVTLLGMAIVVSCGIATSLSGNTVAKK